jgi:hypothetical protein
MRLRAKIRGRRVIAAAATVAAAVSAGLAVPAMAASAAPSGRILSAGQAGTRADVPWSKVGPDWALAMYSASHGGEGVKPETGPATLYLVDPQGGRYKLFTWSARSAQARAPWTLVDWSGDTRRALFSTGYAYGTTRQHLDQLNLRTGRITGFELPRNVNVIGYTRPDGLNILAEKGTAESLTSKLTLQRYSLTGKLQKSLASVTDLGKVAYESGGTALAAGSSRGLELVSNAGGVIRNLPVPAVTDGCSAVRWWTKSTVLASCFVTNEAGPRLWLVPARGAEPTALTPVRTGSSFDLGDFNGWQLSSGLYVDGYGACGTLVIGRQPRHGSEQQVTVPGAASPLIVDATRSALLVKRINGCSPGTSLVWFNPATKALTTAIRDGHNQLGVTGVAPYFIAGKF